MGLPAVAALVISLLFVGTGGRPIHSEGGQLLTAITGALVGGFVVTYLVLVDGRSPLLGLAYILATAGGLLLWRRRWKPDRMD